MVVAKGRPFFTGLIWLLLLFLLGVAQSQVDFLLFNVGQEGFRLINQAAVTWLLCVGGGQVQSLFHSGPYHLGLGVS